MKKLNNYRYIDAINELNYGSYIRWIDISNPEELILNKGALFCELSITDNGIYIICKSFKNKHFKIKMDENLVFQKLSNQESVLLCAFDNI